MALNISEHSRPILTKCSQFVGKLLIVTKLTFIFWSPRGRCYMYNELIVGSFADIYIDHIYSLLCRSTTNCNIFTRMHTLTAAPLTLHCVKKYVEHQSSNFRDYEGKNWNFCNTWTKNWTKIGISHESANTGSLFTIISALVNVCKGIITLTKVLQ